MVSAIYIFALLTKKENLEFDLKMSKYDLKLANSRLVSANDELIKTNTEQIIVVLDPPANLTAESQEPDIILSWDAASVISRREDARSPIRIDSLLASFVNTS